MRKVTEPRPPHFLQKQHFSVAQPIRNSLPTRTNSSRHMSIKPTIKITFKHQNATSKIKMRPSPQWKK
jgi:hypothetical protein